MKKHRGLGRGLDALIPNTADEERKNTESSSENGKESPSTENLEKKKDTGRSGKNEPDKAADAANRSAA